MEKHKLVQRKIFTTDEAWKCTVQKLGKILGPKGKKETGAAISWERRKDVRAVYS